MNNSKNSHQSKKNDRVRPKTLKKEQFEDFEAIVSLMCTNLYRVAHQSIRRWDQNHLIFGSFIKEWALTADSWQEAAPYLGHLLIHYFTSFWEPLKITR